MPQRQYFATFPAGCFGIIARRLKRFRLEELTIIEHDDSSVTFQSPFSPEKLIELRFFTNVYVVIEDFNHVHKSCLKGNYFRLMSLKGGEPMALSNSERTEIETSITAGLGLKANAHLSRNDFYVIERTTGAKFLSLRLSRAKFKREELSAGELRPELAHILCLVGGVKARDTLLDMFAGYGSIPLEAARGFGCGRVIAVDKRLLPNRREHPAIEWRRGDARSLESIESSTIARVVTDPPWGLHDDQDERHLTLLYVDFTKEMERVLASNAVAVVLTGWSQAEDILTKRLKLIGKWTILVSGKKATIYKLQKL